MPSQTRGTEKPLEDLSDRALRDRVKRAERTLKEIDGLDPAELARQRKTDETIARMETATTTIEVANAELARRGRQAMIEKLPLTKAIREAWRGPHPATPVLRAVARFADPEIAGTRLVAGNLSPEEAKELDALVKQRRNLPEGEEIPPGDVQRYEQLVGKAAGDEDLFAKRRNEAAAKEKLAELKEERKVASLPRRPVYAEAGSVTLPRYAVHGWLDRDGDWTVPEIGFLAVVLGMFENQHSLFANGTFEEEAGGDLVLVVSGGIENLRLAVGTNGDPLDAAGSGFVRERVALRTLVRNKWLAAEQSPGQLRIRLGERAKKVRDGKEPREAKSA